MKKKSAAVHMIFVVNICLVGPTGAVHLLWYYSRVSVMFSQTCSYDYDYNNFFFFKSEINIGLFFVFCDYHLGQHTQLNLHNITAVRAFCYSLQPGREINI